MTKNIGYKKTYRILSMFLAFVMVASMVPCTVFSQSSGVVTTDISEKEFAVGASTEFTITTTANDDAGKMVIGTAEFSDPDSIEKLEYYEVQDDNWYPLEGDFGPSAGFPMSDATSTFRVTFKKAGIYSVKIYIKSVDDDSVICSTTATANVNGLSSFITDAGTKTFVVGEAEEFTFSTVANEDAGKMVIGTAEFSDPDAIDALEYYEVQDDNWYPLEGDFGPSAGFPMSDATSTFRVTFKKAGTYTLTAYMREVETGDTLCFTIASVTVKDRSAISFTNEEIEIKYSDVNATNDTLKDDVNGAEYTYKSDDESVVKVNEYGILTPMGVGEAIITVTRKENADYMSASATYTVKVVAGVQGELIWDKTVPNSIKWNDKDGYSNTVSGGSGDGEVTYSSDDTDIAEVDAKTGELTLKKPGTVTITAIKDGGELYDDQSASYTLVVVKAEQEPLSFKESNPNAIYVGDSYTNALLGGSSNSDVIYKVSDKTVASIDENGKLTAIKVPTGKESVSVVVTASLAGDEYYEDAESVTYTITIYRAPQNTLLAFANGTTGQTIKYGATYSNPVSGGDTNPVTYKSSDETVAIVDENGNVTALKAGTVTISASVPESEEYQEQTVSYKLVIELADQSVSFKNEITNIPAITYGDAYENSASAVTEITYSSSDPSVAEVDENGKLIIKKAGTVTITATAAETECYAEAVSSYTITVNKAQQIISFENGDEIRTTFNDNENNVSNNASSNATAGDDEDKKDIEIVYSVESGIEYIVEGTFDPATGTFVIKGAGTIVIAASFTGNERYEANSASYVIVVQKDDQNITFDRTEYDMINGDNSFIAPIATELGNLFGTGKIVYSIKENGDDVVSVIDSATGALTFTGKTGKVTVLATKLADNDYNEATATYTLTVENAALEEDDFHSIVGEKIVDESEWYTGNVSIKADEGYLLSYYTDVNNAEWKDVLEDAVTEDGTFEVTFYVKHIASGRIYEAQTVTVKKDTVAPLASIKHESSTSWEKFLTIISLGTWNPDAKFTVIRDDATAGVASIEYCVVNGAKKIMTPADLAENDTLVWEKYEDGISVEYDKNLTFVVYARVTDEAGQRTFASTNVIVFDKENAVIDFNIETNAQAYHNEVPVFNGNVDVTVNVTEQTKDAYSGIKLVEYWIYCDGAETEYGVLYTFEVEDPTYEQLKGPTYEQLKHEFSGTVTIKAEENNSCDVKLVVRVTDNAGNEFENAVAVDIDITEPVIEVSFDNNDPAKEIEEKGYFPADRIATVKITERTGHFDGTKATSLIKVDTKETLSLNNIISEWTPEIHNNNTTHTATVDFTTDANYEFTLSYTDLANKVCEYEEVVFDEGTKAPRYFAIDKENPYNEKVSINTNVWEEIVETLTFGLWTNDSFEILASADDDTTPVIIEYYKTNGDKTLDESDLKSVTEWVPFDELVLDTHEKFVVYFKFSDYAGNYVFASTDGGIVDKAESLIEFDIVTVEQAYHNDIPVFNGDVDVTVNITEQTGEAYSGIKLVEYWIYCDGTETEKGVLYTFEVENPTYEQLKHEFSDTVTIKATENNSCDVKLVIKVTDNAGNEKTEILPVDIDITDTVIEVSFDNNDPAKEIEEKGYFPANRIATVKFTERTGHFDETKATALINIVAKDFDGDGVNLASDIITWANPTSNGNTGDTTHTAIIDFTTDANYEFTLSYTDLANKVCEYEEVVFDEGTKAPRYFAIDKLAPIGSITAGKLNTWDVLIQFLTFGLWSKEAVDVNGTVKDETTPIESVSYYKTDNITALDVAALELIENWEPLSPTAEFDVTTVKPNEKFVVYLKFVDFAGNVSYISTDGIVVDDTIPSFETVKPEIKITTETDNIIFNSDVNIGVSVIDPNPNDLDAYAGLKEIRYEVYNLGEKTQEGVLYSFEYTVENGDPVLRIYNKGELVSERKDYKPTHEDLLPAWSDDAAIVVKKELNNSNDVEIVVYAVDNAGNANEESCKIKIDTTPADIKVSYDNNDGDTTFADGTFFRSNRTATIVVTERNFDPANFKFVITNIDGYVPIISDWETGVGTEPNGDDTTHTATILFDKDGDYEFTIESCVDLANNANNEPNTGDSLAPWEFTVDKTAPVVNIVYDNNDVLNGNYYKAQRIVTITVTEHNFETGRIVINLKATDDGVATKLPTVSNWVSNGNVHTATITYDADALYTFDFDYTDKAGNATANIAEQTFYVDKTNPVLKIEKIVDESANNDEGDIGFVMTATDTNFDVFTPVLTAVVRNGDKFEVKQLEVGEITDIENGKVFTVTNIEADGIYRITCTIVDKAGNAYSEVTLEKADGSTYVEQRAEEDTLVTFSVNRDGSTFEVDANTLDIVGRYYIQNVVNDISIVEINADPLKEYTVTLNGKELVKDTDYTVTTEGGGDAWMKYTYKANKDLFAAEGEYKLVVSSKDKADNDAFSDVKEAAVEFVVDRTAPVVTVSGIATDGRYQAESQSVTLIPTDDGGALNTLIVNMVDEDGKVIKEVINLSGEALATKLEENDGKITFEIAEGLYQNVQIICTDCATGDTDTTNTHDTTIQNVSVSSSVFMIFWANKPLRWGTIGGLGAIAIALAVFVVLKNKKRKAQ